MHKLLGPSFNATYEYLLCKQKWSSRDTFDLPNMVTLSTQTSVDIMRLFTTETDLLQRRLINNHKGSTLHLLHMYNLINLSPTVEFPRASDFLSMMYARTPYHDVTPSTTQKEREASKLQLPPLLLLAIN